VALYAFDGTWNQEKTAGEYDKNTNVVFFKDAYTKNAANHFYTKGVGTKHGRLGKIFGGAFGAGGKTRVSEAYAHLVAHYLEGDEVIDIVGFSRGAALALHFTNEIHKNGIRDPKSGKRLVKRPYIRFLGLWATGSGLHN